MTTILKKWLILFSVLFTATTLFSSTLYLFLGETTDTHAHILMRGGFVFIAATTITLFYEFTIKPVFLRYFLPYAVAQGLVLFLVFIMGTYQTLHPTAYRDAFTNFTGVSIIVIAVLATTEYIRYKKSLT